MLSPRTESWQRYEKKQMWPPQWVRWYWDTSSGLNLCTWGVQRSKPDCGVFLVQACEPAHIDLRRAPKTSLGIPRIMHRIADQYDHRMVDTSCPAYSTLWPYCIVRSLIQAELQVWEAYGSITRNQLQTWWPDRLSCVTRQDLHRCNLLFPIYQTKDSEFD